MGIPREEYPRPNMVRRSWICLNGSWEFEVDSADSGEERGLLDRPLRDRILVPFSPETPLSGLALEDFLPAVWYHRRFQVPRDWTDQRILLHLQAVDYEATVWVNGTEVGRHRGGFTPFTCDISEVAHPGAPSDIVVRARDDPSRSQPRGKQTDRLRSYGSRIPRTTGIWQTVWLEPVSQSWLARPRITPNLSSGSVVVEQPLNGPRRGLVLCAKLRDEQAIIAEAEVPAEEELTPVLLLNIPHERRRPWTPEDPYLYSLTILLQDASGYTVDKIASYAALRSVSIGDGAILLNGRRRFQRLVLDQGCWPAGGLTAPDDEALARDIVIAKAAGFDGARAHQRVAEERWLYHADRLGYLVWGEFPDWSNRRDGPPVHHLRFSVEHVGQWLEALHRDYSHPCIVGWCALNETEQPYGGKLSDLDDITKALYLAARVADGSRPVIDVSGYCHRIAEADVWDCHDYEQDPAIFAEHYRHLPQLAEGVDSDGSGHPGPAPRPGQAILVSEFGGTRIEDGTEEQDWGYGPAAASGKDLLQKFSALCRVLLSNKHVSGYCYTQLTDTYQEKNGLFDSERNPKVAPDRLAAAQSATAAIEGMI